MVWTPQQIAHNNGQFCQYMKERNSTMTDKSFIRQRKTDLLFKYKKDLSDLTKPKGQKEDILREIRKLERELGIEGENYNG